MMLAAEYTGESTRKNCKRAKYKRTEMSIGNWSQHWSCDIGVEVLFLDLSSGGYLYKEKGLGLARC